MTNKNTEYDIQSYEEAVNNGNYTVEFKKSKFTVSIKDSRKLSFHIPGGLLGHRSEFFYGKELAIQLSTDYYYREKNTTIEYSTLPMRSLNLFIDCFLRIIINDDFELIARWFIAGGDNYLKSEKDVVSLFISRMNLHKYKSRMNRHKYKEYNEIVLQEKREMFEALKSELSAYTRSFKEALTKRSVYYNGWIHFSANRFKEALTKRSVYYNSYLSEICLDIKNILKKYIKDDALVEHPEDKIPTFRKRGSLDMSDELDYSCWE